MAQKNKVGLLHLTFIGLAGIIGSGWLFASMYAAQTAGMGAFVAWMLGALLMLAVTSCLSELINLYPRRGLLASVCSFSHNQDFSFIIAIANWFGVMCAIPSEAIATMRYLSWPSWAVIPLIIVYAVLNSWGVKLFTKFNTLLTLFKFIVPTMTVITLLSHGINTNNFHADDVFNVNAILSVLITSGVVYSFNGCQMIVNFTSEAINPKRNIPLALFISLSISTILYMLLQFSYLGGADLSINYHDPFIQLALSLGLGWLVVFLQVDAAISPSGTGIMYLSSCTRMLTAMSREGQMPEALNVKSERYNMSHRSLLMNVVLCIGLFMVFKTWESFVILVSTFHLISYLAAPLALGRLRITMPDHPRNFSLPFQSFICPLLFFVISYLFTVATVHTDVAVSLICISFLVLYLLMNYRTWQTLLPALRRSAFIPAWLLLFTLCAFFQTGFWSIFVLSMILYYIGIGRGATEGG